LEARKLKWKANGYQRVLRKHLIGKILSNILSYEYVRNEALKLQEAYFFNVIAGVYDLSALVIN